jgi:hypothetical protein
VIPLLITAEDLVNYTVFDEVKEREGELLKQDILEAEVEVKGIAGHDFTDEAYQPLPAEVKLALLKMAQYFALVNADESLTKGIKSEKIGDYSYTVADTGGTAKPDISALLKAFIKQNEPADTGTVRLRMRAL